MAGRHRRPPAWRRLLSSLVRSRDRVRTAALQAEVLALRSTVAALQEELAKLRVQAADAPAAEAADEHWVTLRMPLVRLALADPDELTAGPDVAAALAAPDRGPDTAETQIVLEPAAAMAPAPADHLAWRVLAGLPERPLLDPRTDRDSEPRDPAAPTAAGATEHRRSA